VAGALALAAARPAAAAEEIALAWEDCASGTAAALDLAGDCDSNLGFAPLHASFRMPFATGPDVIGLELVLDLQHAQAVLPDWWRLAPGQCRAGQLSADTDFSAAAACGDPWGGLGAALVQGWTATQPFGQPNQARMLVTVGVGSLDARALDATTDYNAVRIRLGLALSSGFGSCPGCTGGACLVLNSIAVRRLPGAPGGDLFLTQPRAGNLNRVTWYGGQGADCSAVPVRRTSWGLMKSLYR